MVAMSKHLSLWHQDQPYGVRLEVVPFGCRGMCFRNRRCPLTADPVWASVFRTVLSTIPNRSREGEKKTNAKELWNLSTLTYNLEQDALEGQFNSHRKYLLVIIAEDKKGCRVGKCELVIFPKVVVVWFKLEVRVWEPLEPDKWDRGSLEEKYVPPWETPMRSQLW